MAVENDETLKREQDAFLKARRPEDRLLSVLWDAGHLARERSAADKKHAEELAEQGDASTDHAVEPDTPEKSAAASAPLTIQRSLPLETRLRAAARDLSRFGSDDAFTTYPIKPNNEFPTLLTRVPIFRPSRRLTQQKFQDADNSVSFETSWGTGRRHGPPLTTRDEDTLIALLMLRDRGLSGPSTHLPENVKDIFQSPSGKADVHRVTCTIDQINEFLGLSDGGKNFKNTLASIKRLNACKIEMEKVVFDGSRVGGAFDLVKIQWRVFEEHGLIDAVFPPVMAHWLVESYTFIDWNTRKQLTPLGKALHRFLSGQKYQYRIALLKLAATIGYDGRSNHMKKYIAKALDELVEIGWLERYDIKGSGRAVPFIVHIQRRVD